MVRSAPIGFRIRPETKQALETAAKADRRSMSSLIEIILEDWLREKGYLPREEGL